MPVFIETLTDGACERLNMICLCMDEKRDAVWLELTNYETSLLHASAPHGRVGRAHVGAVKEGSDWKPIAHALKAKEKIQIEPSLSVEKVRTFHQAIMTEWNKFTPATAREYAKGTTLGKSLNHAGFVAKALKTGYEAIGIKREAYSGVKLTDWTVDGLLKYVERMKTGTQATDSLGFTEYAPDLHWAATENSDRTGVFDPILSGKPHSGKFAYDDHFKKNPDFSGGIKRVVAYGFRGDDRPPSDIKAAGGLWPNYTRPDHIKEAAEKKNAAKLKAWEEEVLHVGQHTQNQFFKGFISTTRAPEVAKEFALENGYVYVLFVEGGFDIPLAHPFGRNHENEISMPGGLEWDDVVGYRRTNERRLFVGSIYLKPAAFKGEKPEVVGTIVAGLSGKHLAKA